MKASTNAGKSFTRSQSLDVKCAEILKLTQIYSSEIQENCMKTVSVIKRKMS